MPEVNIGGIIWPSFNSTNGIAIDIFLTGCSRHCKNCHNPNLWDKNAGIRMEIEELVRIIKSKRVVDSIAIMGGEPLENEHLPELLSAIREAFPQKEIWLYTSYNLDEVTMEIQDICDFIKTGQYVEKEHCDGRLASKNQQIFKNYDGIYALYYSFERGIIDAQNSNNSY